jgi:non-heme chloroperoxidase
MAFHYLKGAAMPYITTSDGVEIYYTEQGTGQPIVFSHGWPLSSDAWQPELKFFSDNGYRTIAHDRRGHGRSSKTAEGHTIDQYARDLAQVIEALDLHDVILIGHSTGGGEAVRYAAQYANGRVAKVVTAGAIPPIMVKSDANPDGTPIEAFDAIRAGVLSDASQFWLDLAESFFGANHGVDVSYGAKLDFWRQGQLVNLSAAYDCVKAFSETDQTEDLKALTVPILLAHGEDDQIVPIDDAARKAIDLVQDGTLKTYPGAPHGIYGAYRAQLDQDILDWIRL